MKITKTFFDDIRALIVAARNTVARGVDLVQVYTNFEIGRRIVHEEQKGKQRADYGKEVLKALAERLTEEFGKGFSASNLAYMRTFFLLYQDQTSIFQTVSGKSAGAKKLQALTAKSASNQKSQTLSDQSPIAQTVSGQLAALKILQTASGKLQDQTGMVSAVPFQIGQTSEALDGRSRKMMISR